MGCDPLEFMAEVVMGKHNATLDQRMHCAKEVAQYIHPKLRALEVSNSVDDDGNTVPFIVGYDSLPSWLNHPKNQGADG